VIGRENWKGSKLGNWGSTRGDGRATVMTIADEALNVGTSRGQDAKVVMDAYLQ
jgi:hypothetical protein